MKKYFIVYCSVLILGCTPNKNTNLSSISSDLPSGQLVHEPKIIDIDYNEVFVTRTSDLPQNSRTIKLQQLAESTQTSQGSSQKYFLEDRIVFSEEKNQEPSDVTLLFKTHCLDGQTQETTYHEGSMPYKNQINLIELLPEKLFSNPKQHSCDFNFKAENKDGKVHLFSFPHLPIHSFEQAVNTSFHNNSADFSKEVNLNEEMIVYFDKMRDQEYYLDVWYDDTIDEIKLSCDFINHSFPVRKDSRYYLFQIPGWDRISEEDRKDQNCRLFTFSNNNVAGVSQSFYLDFKDQNIQTEVVQNISKHDYNKNILPQLNESLKKYFSFEKVQVDDFITLKVENNGEVTKRLYIPAKVDLDKSYHFFWRNYFDRFYKEQEGVLQLSPKLNSDIQYHESDLEKGILISLNPQQKIELQFDLKLDNQNLCDHRDYRLREEKWSNLRETISSVSEDFLTDIKRDPFPFFQDYIGLVVASFIEFSKPQVYEVSLRANLEQAQKEAEVIDEVINTSQSSETHSYSYSFDYAKYSGMREYFEQGRKKHSPTDLLPHYIRADKYSIPRIDELFNVSKYEFAQSFHGSISERLHGSPDSSANQFFLKRSNVTYFFAHDFQHPPFLKELNSEDTSYLYGIRSVMEDSPEEQGFLKFNEFSCEYIDMEMNLFEEMFNIRHVNYYLTDDYQDYSLKQNIQELNEGRDSRKSKVLGLAALLIDHGLSFKEFSDLALFWRNRSDYTSEMIPHQQDIQNLLTSYMQQNNLVDVSSISVSYKQDGFLPTFTPLKGDMNPEITQNSEFARVQNMEHQYQKLLDVNVQHWIKEKQANDDEERRRRRREQNRGPHF